MLKLKKRVRNIDLKYSSLSGQISSKKLQKSIQFESSLERDFIYLIEFDIDVKEYLEQPLIIPYTDLYGKHRKYTPDFLISYHDKFRKKEIIEIKYEEELIKNNKELNHKLNEARLYCIRNNMVFRVCSDNYIRNKNCVLLRNVKFLSRYRDYYDDINYKHTGVVVNTQNAHLLMEKLRMVNEYTISQLINHTSNDNQDVYFKAKLIFLIWYLIANNHIECDLSQWLSYNTIIWTDLK